MQILPPPKAGQSDDMAVHHLGVLAGVDQIRGIAAGADNDQHIAGAHQVAQLEAVDLIEGNIIAQRGDFLNIVTY